MKTSITNLSTLKPSDLEIFTKWLKHHTDAVTHKITQLIVKARTGVLQHDSLVRRVARIAHVTIAKALELVHETEFKLNQWIQTWVGPRRPQRRVSQCYRGTNMVFVCVASGTFA
jgi:hypothetical protein